jgi:superfamily II DNA or RNA helicase
VKIEAVIHDSGCLITGASRAAEKAIQTACSWSVGGAEYSEAFKSHLWDGKVKLWKAANGGIEVPIGMMKTAFLACKATGDKVFATDKRTECPREIYKLRDDLSLRPHQIAAREIVTRPGVLRGVGTLKMPIRSGKTLTGAAIIAALEVRTLFVVPTLLLMRQAAAEIGLALGEEIGLIGDGERTIRRVTVANAGSLAAIRKTDKATFAKLRGVGLLMVDEMHHMKGGAWTRACAALHPRYRIGLSATVYFDDDSEVDRGILHAMALCGPVVHDVSISEMVAAGFLVAPTIKIHRCDTPKTLQKKRWSVQTAASAIHANDDRNRKIVDLAVSEAKAGRRVIVVCTRILQVDALAELLSQTDVRHSATCGGDNYEATIRDLKNGERPIAVTTTLGEGVNVPEVDAVIIAAGGRDAKATMQRLRCLTAIPGKSTAIIHDFWDDMNPYCLQHSEARTAVYKSEACFRIVFEGGEKSCTRPQAPAIEVCPF